MAMLTWRRSGRAARSWRWLPARRATLPVGWDSEFESATFDADGIDDEELEAVIFEELDAREPDWRSHLKLVD